MLKQEEEILELERQLKNQLEDPKEDKESQVIVDAAIEESSNEEVNEGSEEETEDASEEGSEDEVQAESDDEGPGKKANRKQRIAWKELREEAKTAKKEAQELKERLARLEGYTQAQQKPEAPRVEVRQEDIEPDKTIDPDGWMQWKISKVENEQRIVQDQLRRQQEENVWLQHEREYAKKFSHYDDAKQFLLDTRYKEIKNQFPYATDAQIKAHISQEEREAVRNSIKMNMDPADTIMLYAQKYGYKPREEKKEASVEQKQGTDFDQIKRNVKKSSSLMGGASRGPSSSELTEEIFLNMPADKILNMPADKLEAFDKKMMKQVYDDLTSN